MTATRSGGGWQCWMSGAALVLSPLLLCCSAKDMVAVQPDATRPDAVQPDTAILRRTVVIGASASAGFGTGSGDEAYTLAQMLDCALRPTHEPVLSFASEMVFFSPVAHGRSQVDMAKAAEPTLVFALDYLFWFGYGLLPSQKARLARLDRGLAFLDELDCPVVIGRIPRMSGAVGRILMAEQVPSVEEVVALNARIEGWAAERSSVHLLPLPAMLEELKESGQLQLASGTWPRNREVSLLQDDRLHPTVPGLAVLALWALEQLQQRKVLNSDDILWDADELIAQVQVARSAN